MEAYTEFAAVYDEFMDNVPYDEWADYLHGLLQKDGIEDGLVLDLGCGTGAMTERMAAFGYDMIGADNSEEMLEIAMEKRLNFTERCAPFTVSVILSIILQKKQIWKRSSVW